MGQATNDRLAGLSAGNARAALLGAASFAVLAVAGVLLVAGVTSAEVAATVLVLPVFAAGFLGGRVAGYVSAAVATLLYVALRRADFADAGVAGAGIVTLTRAVAYAVVGHIGSLARTLLPGGADDAAEVPVRPGRPAGAASGRRAGEAARPATSGPAWNTPWAEGERMGVAGADRRQPVLAGVGATGAHPGDDAGYLGEPPTTSMSGAWPGDPGPSGWPDDPPARRGSGGDVWDDTGGWQAGGDARPMQDDTWAAVQESWRRQHGLPAEDQPTGGGRGDRPAWPDDEHDDPWADPAPAGPAGYDQGGYPPPAGPDGRGHADGAGSWPGSHDQTGYDQGYDQSGYDQDGYASNGGGQGYDQGGYASNGGGQVYDQGGYDRGPAADPYGAAGGGGPDGPASGSYDPSGWPGTAAGAGAPGDPWGSAPPSGADAWNQDAPPAEGGHWAAGWNPPAEDQWGGQQGEPAGAWDAPATGEWPANGQDTTWDDPAVDRRPGHDDWSPPITGGWTAVGGFDPTIGTGEHAAATGGYDELPAVDHETGLWTAKFLRDRLASERDRSRRSGHPFSLVLVQVPDGPLAQLPYRRQLTLLRELGYQFVAGGVVDHLVHVPDQQQHWFAVILPDTDRSGAQVLERRLRLGIGGYLSSRGLPLRDLESASLTAPDDDPAMGQIWDALIGPDDGGY